MIRNGHLNPTPGWSPLPDNSVENDEARGPEGYTDCTWHLGVENIRDTRVRLRLEKEKLL